MPRATGLTAAWQGMQSVTGDRTMPMLKKAFGSYNAYEDPKFYQDLQMFEQNPTAQRADMMLKEYGDTLDAEDQQALLSKITPMEGTPQYYDWKNAETQYNINQDKATQVGIETEGMQEYYMPTKALEFQMLDDRADMTATEAENFGEMQDLEMEAQELQNHSQRLANEYREETDPIKKQMLQQEWQMAQDSYNARLNQIIANSNITQDQAEVSDATVQDRIDRAGAQARSAALNNELKENELWQSNRERKFLEGLGDNELMSALGLGGGTGDGGQNALSPERIVGQTADGRNIYSGIGGGYITTDPRTGQVRSVSREEFDNANISTGYGEVMVDPFEMLWNDPIARNTLGQDTITEMATSGQYPRQMTLDEARKFIDNLTYDFDISDILTSGSLAQNYRPEQSLNEYIQNGGQTQPQKIAQNFIASTPGGRERVIEILQNIQDPEQFKEDYGIDRTAILQELRNME